MTKLTETPVEKPFNGLPFLPPPKDKIETINVLRQLVTASLALAELKGLAHTLPNPDILLNAVILNEAIASSEIENVVTTQDKLYQALSAKGTQPDSATKEVLRYREATLYGFRFIKKKGFLHTNAIVEIQQVLGEIKRESVNYPEQLSGMRLPERLFILLRMTTTPYSNS